jgi:hypothetical protein
MTVMSAGRQVPDFRSALSKAIHDRWLIGEAEDEGLKISDAEVGHEVAELTDEILARTRRRERAVTQAEVARFYAARTKQFASPQRRDVHIVRTTTRAAALAARRRIESGASFASVAKQLSAVAQPVRSTNGLITGLTPNYYSEKPLNDAIFSARRGRVYGPVFASERQVVASQAGTGYFVFEVIRVTPRRRLQLALVRSEIASILTERRRKATLAAAVKAFRKKWTAQTDCSPGYIVAGCRQAKPSNAPSTDPSGL